MVPNSNTKYMSSDSSHPSALATPDRSKTCSTSGSICTTSKKSFDWSSPSRTRHHAVHSCGAALRGRPGGGAEGGSTWAGRLGRLVPSGTISSRQREYAAPRPLPPPNSAMPQNPQHGVAEPLRQGQGLHRSQHTAVAAGVAAEIAARNTISQKPS